MFYSKFKAKQRLLSHISNYKNEENNLVFPRNAAMQNTNENFSVLAQNKRKNTFADMQIIKNFIQSL